MDSTIFNSLNVNGRLLDLFPFRRLWVYSMLHPILFYAGSRSRTEADIAARARQILDEGASMIDIGAYSSGPNAEHLARRRNAAFAYRSGNIEPESSGCYHFS